MLRERRQCANYSFSIQVLFLYNFILFYFHDKTGQNHTLTRRMRSTHGTFCSSHADDSELYVFWTDFRTRDECHQSWKIFASTIIPARFQHFVQLTKAINQFLFRPRSRTDFQRFREHNVVFRKSLRSLRLSFLNV